MDQDPRPSTSKGSFGPGLGRSTDTITSNDTERGDSNLTQAEFSSSTEGGRSNSSELGSSSTSSPAKTVPEDKKKFKVDKVYLKARLSEVAYEVTQERGTELPYTGDLLELTTPGTYYCLICDNELFASHTKFDAACGWPSFWATIDQSKVVFTPDNTADRPRTEVTCARCDSHLGHFFENENTPSGNRYCINSCALVFRRADEPVPSPKQANPE